MEPHAPCTAHLGQAGSGCRREGHTQGHRLGRGASAAHLELARDGDKEAVARVVTGVTMSLHGQKHSGKWPHADAPPGLGQPEGPNPCATAPQGDAVTPEVPPSAAPSATTSEGHQTPQSSPRKAALSPGSLCLPVPHRQGGSAASHPRSPRVRRVGMGAPSRAEPLCRSVCARGCSVQTLLGDTLTHRGGLETPHATQPTSHPPRSPPGTRSSQSHASGARSPQGPRDVSEAPAPWEGEMLSPTPQPRTAADTGN